MSLLPHCAEPYEEQRPRLSGQERTRLQWGSVCLGATRQQVTDKVGAVGASIGLTILAKDFGDKC